MAKEKRTASDLDAELAALEAELAALEGKKKGKKAAPAAPASVPQPRAPAPSLASPMAPAEKKTRFAMPKLGRKKPEAPAAVEAPATLEVAPALAPARPAPAAPAPAPPRAESYDASVWRQEGDEWVRVVPETPVPVIRRVLDEDGTVVREEPAHTRDVEDVSGMKAERGLGRLLRRK